MKKLKKTGKMLLCLTLALSVVGGMLMLRAEVDWSDTRVGALSQYYETGSTTGGNGNPGFISTVPGDVGGTSYGVYMFASKPGVPLAFAKWLQQQTTNSVYKEMGDKLVNAYYTNLDGSSGAGYGPNFDAAWTDIAAKNSSGFYDAQHDYWKSVHYNDLADWVEKQYGVDINKEYGLALQNVLWSRSVHHGVSGTQYILEEVFKKLGGFKYQPEAEIIEAIYDECGRLATKAEIADKKMDKTMSGALAKKYGVNGEVLRYFFGSSGAVQMSVYRRLQVNEPLDALAILCQRRSSDALLADGTYTILDNAGQKTAVFSNATVTAAVEGHTSDMVITWFEGGFYTIACKVGDATKRLAADGSVVFQDPSASAKQHWIVAEAADGQGRTLKNVATGQYLKIGDAGSLTLVDGEENASRWYFAPQAVYTLHDPVLPGENNNLAQGDSSFPIRGIITGSAQMQKVALRVTNGGANGSIVKYCSPEKSTSGNYYDLSNMDSSCSISKLPKGEYTISVLVMPSGKDSSYQTIYSEPFSITDPPATGTTDTAEEEFTVTFDAAGGSCKVSTRRYKMGEVYGVLPEATKADGKFLGWFMEDGTEVTVSTAVAAKDHTLTARYGSKYTVTFKPGDGTDDVVKYYGEGELIVAPESPIKASDSSYHYSFSHWADENDKQFNPGETYMGKANVIYTAVYTKTEITVMPPTTTPDPGDGDGSGTTTPPDGGGTTTPTQPPASSGYLTNITPGTDVAKLTARGYTVYSGKKEVTSGKIATGMKAVSGNSAVDIVVTGDSNGDGMVNVLDVVKVRSHILKKSTLDGAYVKAADLNGDKTVDISDVLLATQYALGKKTFN